MGISLEITSISIRSSIKYIELVTAIVGSFYFYKYSESFLKYFLIILWYTVVNEFVGFFLKKIGFYNNIVIYNVFHFINFTFLIVLFNQYLKLKRHKVLTLFFLLIYISSFLLNMFYENYIIEVQTVPFFIASLCIIVSILLYFSEALNTDEVLYVRKRIIFWIGVGYLIYLTGNFPIRVIRNYFVEVVNLEQILEVSSVLSIVLNGCFIIGFVWAEKDKQY